MSLGRSGGWRPVRVRFPMRLPRESRGLVGGPLISPPRVTELRQVGLDLRKGLYGTIVRVSEKESSKIVRERKRE